MMPKHGVNLHTRITLAGLLAVVVLSSVGCGPRDFRNENDRLRAEVMQLEQTNERLERRLRELEAELRRVELSDLDPEVREQIPHVVRIEVERYSHLRDRSGDGQPDELVLHVTSRDGRDRFVNLLGTLSVRGVQMAGESTAPIVVNRSFDAEAVRDAYRSSFMGTHYSFRISLGGPEDREEVDQRHLFGPDDSLAIRVQFEDALTGRVMADERVVRQRIGRSEGRERPGRERERRDRGRDRSGEGRSER
ncbi:MAG: hypothetical protein EA377_09180 [Phycisphaerales bacterium]|nr:MAG: hypothetical protein EA377_09180 [Phycisphaerales bacterium]